ncbi:DUF503 family protein [Bacillus aquiflavi]|uniref:DUF503 domain-containing protein n=1 Tax=Bacillus aquiflavi TaxID=2672567 RepID=UPI001CA91231|nr:DUF503 family protein [Bacillus aquiflavi]UAC49990.1 DUF503 family protein [Bacillus aquiflavi]
MIGSAVCELIIYNAHSLKEKRAVLQGILTRLKEKFNIAIAEVDHQNVWQRTTIAVCSVSSSKVQVEKELQRVFNFIDSFPEVERTMTEIEWL